ncbi:hypothetical protein [Saccharopolyspora pogona]|uniref:hypothetical protein n=1 Tax=Saccharopolyspora pogona TaxID=333966 RepID=UPI001CC22E65|nr:hypothetical protein [Saccharopolyspora pogona]
MGRLLRVGGRVVVLVVGSGGEVGGAEGGGPHALEVVLGLAQVEVEGLVKQAEPGQGFLQAVDGAGGGLEVAVQVVGGRVVGSTLGQLPPLFAFAASKGDPRRRGRTCRKNGS